MKKIMNAPINTFFDITPVGKILVRFSSDLEVFKEGLFWPFRNFLNDVASIVSTVFILLYVSPWNVFVLLAFIKFFSDFAMPFLAIDNQMHRFHSMVYTPIHSLW